MTYYSYGNRIYSINEASTFTKWIKDEDLPEYTKQEEKREKKEAKELSSLVKKAKRSGELKKFKSKLMKYTEKLSNESVAGIEEDNDGVADSSVCPNCGQLTPKV